MIFTLESSVLTMCVLAADLILFRVDLGAKVFKAFYNALTHGSGVLTNARCEADCINAAHSQQRMRR